MSKLREWSDEEVRRETRDMGYPLKAYKAEELGKMLLATRRRERELRKEVARLRAALRKGGK